MAGLFTSRFSCCARPHPKDSKVVFQAEGASHPLPEKPLNKKWGGWGEALRREVNGPGHQATWVDPVLCLCYTTFPGMENMSQKGTVETFILLPEQKASAPTRRQA